MTSTNTINPATLTDLDTLDYSPGTFGCHEALDRCGMIADMLDMSLVIHPSVKANPEWLKLAATALDNLHDLYQLIGVAHFNAVPLGQQVPNQE